MSCLLWSSRRTARITGLAEISRNQRRSLVKSDVLWCIRRCLTRLLSVGVRVAAACGCVQPCVRVCVRWFVLTVWRANRLGYRCKLEWQLATSHAASSLFISGDNQQRSVWHVLGEKKNQQAPSVPSFSSCIINCFFNVKYTWHIVYWPTVESEVCVDLVCVDKSVYLSE